jgi:hypothetical protein
MQALRANCSVYHEGAPDVWMRQKPHKSVTFTRQIDGALGGNFDIAARKHFRREKFPCFD